MAKRDVWIHLVLFLQPSKLSDGLVQQFLLPDQTPSILEAEMSLRAEQQLIGSNKLMVAAEDHSRNQEVTSPLHQKDTVKPEMSGEKLQPKREQEERIEEVKQVKQVEEAEERQEPEGRQADVTVTEQRKREVSGATSL